MRNLGEVGRSAASMDGGSKTLQLGRAMRNLGESGEARRARMAAAQRSLVCEAYGLPTYQHAFGEPVLSDREKAR